MQDELKHLLDFVLEPAARTTAWTTSTWSCPPATTRTSPSARTRPGTRPPETLEEVGRASASSSCPTRAAPPSTARRSPCRPRTPSAAPGRCRTDPARLQPARGFGLEYTAADGTRQRPVMIHRALFGSIERFFGVLIEHYAGAFPAWLAPGAGRSRSPSPSAFDDYLDDVVAQLRGARHPRRARPVRRPVRQEDPQRVSKEKVPVHAHRGRRGRRGRRRVLPVPRRHARRTACRSPRPSSASWRRSATASRS